MAHQPGPVTANETEANSTNTGAPEGPQPLVSPLLSPLLSDVPGVVHGFFTRQGGTSWGRGDLNCGLGAEDDPSHVDENRRRVRDHLSAQGLVSLTQTHSAQVHSLTAAPDWPRGQSGAAVRLCT